MTATLTRRPGLNTPTGSDVVPSSIAEAAGGGDAAAEHTRLALDEVANLDLSAVLLSWDSTLSSAAAWVSAVSRRVNDQLAHYASAVEEMNRIAVPWVVRTTGWSSFQESVRFLLPGNVDDVETFAPPVEPESTAVHVIANISEVLGVPVSDVLEASGIRRRTYQHWKATAANPRLSSQGRLWELSFTVRVLAESLGKGLRQWLHVPARLELLANGDFDTLTRQLLSQQARAGKLGEVDDRDERRRSAGYFDDNEPPLPTRTSRPSAGTARKAKRPPATRRQSTS